MKIIRTKDYADMSRKAANIISAQVIMKPDCVLGLATGGTPVGTYEKLVERYNEGDLDFSEVTSVNLDEYRGLPKEHPESYWSFMHRNLFDCVNIDPAKTNLPDGTNPDAADACAKYNAIIHSVGGINLQQLGLGYLTLGEATPSLSGGEAQRLKLASEMGKGQADTVFVFDEPTIGLHPLDVRTLLGVFQRLIDSGATVVVIEHDLDVIRNADYLVDLGPGGGESGGRIVACGTPEQVAADPASITGKYLHL